MEVAKRQETEKPVKTEPKKIHDWSENFKWNKYSPLLAQHSLYRQAQWGGDK